MDKLQREPHLDLSRMQDIGGCRAVVGSHDDLRRLEDRICNGRLPVLAVADYVQNPRISGYRGVHVIVTYEGRAIEMQLRTEVMHAWALAAETYSHLVGLNLKQDGDHPIQLFLRSTSEVMARHEAHLPVPDEVGTLLAVRRLAAQPYLKGVGR